MKLKFILFIASLSLNVGLQAQFFKKIKEAATGNTQEVSSVGSSKMIGEKEISSNVKADEFGVNGIYYSQTEKGIIKTNLQFEICPDKSTAKGAQDLPACLMFHYEIPETSSTIWRGKNAVDDYAYPENLLRSKRVYFPSRGMYGDIFQIESGVLFMADKGYSGFFVGSNAEANKPDFDFTRIVKAGSFFVKNKEDLKKWTASPEVIAKVKENIQQHLKNINSIYAEVEAKKNSKNEMPSIGKLNSKFLQDRALKTYKEKYEPINKGWTHHYAYVHGNEWVNKKAYDKSGVLRDTHRELQVVIVRTSPSGECRADLMYYVELYENGKYNTETGKVSGPVSYIGMPGGVLPCDKAMSFKNKL